ncbi:hypothetical protein ABW20_dc0104190 [Dactylellina cionopaga]|nr:hypothetical protein ABW20_dc0104190 [Dactylellina cionopaga]
MTLLALSNEILLEVFRYLSNNDLGLVKRVCSRFDSLEALTIKRTYIFQVDAISWPAWRFARHLLTNPETGKRFTTVNIQWHHRTYDGSRSRYWKWTADEAEKIIEICEKHKLSETIKQVVLGGVNSEALLPFVFCFMPNLESLDMGEANPDLTGFVVGSSLGFDSIEKLRCSLRPEEAKEVFGSYDSWYDEYLSEEVGYYKGGESDEEEDGESDEEEEDGESDEEEEDAEAWLQRRGQISDFYSDRRIPDYTTSEYDELQSCYESIRRNHFCPFDENCGGPTLWPVGLANLRNLTHVQIMTPLDCMDYNSYISRIFFLPNIQSLKFKCKWNMGNRMYWANYSPGYLDFDFENSESLKSSVKVLMLSNLELEQEEVVNIAQITSSLETLVLDLLVRDEFNIQSAGECFLQHNKQTLRKEVSRIRIVPKGQNDEKPQWGDLTYTDSDSSDSQNR